MPGYHGIATADGYSRSRRLTAALKKGQKVLVMVSNIILNIWYMYMSGFPIHVYVYVYTCVCIADPPCSTVETDTTL